MKKIKQLGICMDHAHAFLMELENGKIISRNIASSWRETEPEVNQDSHLMRGHSSEKKFLQAIYYKEISEIIKHYQQVVLFGPTDAKNELHNLLTNDHLFNDVKIELVTADKMTQTERQEFVVKYFM
jgi:hypothetical protein